MLREKDKVFRNAMVLFDAFIISLVFLFSFFLRLHIHDFYKLDLFPGTSLIVDTSSLSISDYLIVLFFVVPIWSAALYLNGMYKSLRTKTSSGVLWIILKAAFFTAITFGAAAFVFKLKFVSRAFFVIFMAISVFALMAEKIAIFTVAHYMRKQGYNYRRLIVVGTGRRASQFISNVRNHLEWGLRIVGLIDYDEGLKGKEFEGSKVIGTLDDLPGILHGRSIDEVVFIVPRAKLDSIQKSIYVCETEGVKATIAADLFELKIARAKLTELEGMPLVTFETTVAEEWELFIKRGFDIVASGLGIIILSPVFLLTAILVKLTSPGPVFYINKRVGLNGRKFVFYKFRSMYRGAHVKLSELMEKNEMNGPIFKIKNDPRITPLGRFMRKFSIDELPQLFNVLIGEMSLVGPRPPIPQEVARYEPWQRRRLSMRPGITCIWQVSGRSKIGFDEWMRMDLEYIDNWSLWLDVKILLKTIPAVLFGIGAY
ncbi:MAG: sugar transferase [Candidatus Omnitrophota bacterium]|jgi:exopolysaccharide biosynthesis polyprenyl glycosylphosphotransferase